LLAYGLPPQYFAQLDDTSISVQVPPATKPCARPGVAPRQVPKVVRFEGLAVNAPEAATPVAAVVPVAPCAPAVIETLIATEATASAAIVAWRPLLAKARGNAVRIKTDLRCL
jgi:hypothetical protein